MELKDAYGNPVSSSSRAAVDAYDRGVRALLGFGADTIDSFRAALQADPGFALARACAEAGAAVTLIAGPSALVTPAGVTRVDVRSAPVERYRDIVASARADDQNVVWDPHPDQLVRSEVWILRTPIVLRRLTGTPINGV